MELDYGRIGMRIRQLRKVKGWSQDELAKNVASACHFWDILSVEQEL